MEKQYLSVNIVQLKMVREKSVKYDTAASNPRSIVDMVKPIIADSYRELVIVVGLNNSNVPTCIHVVGIGNVNQAELSSASVFKPLLLSNSMGFIILHNHPGDSLHPSEADHCVTKKLFDLGKQLEISMLDHLILNADASRWFSMRESSRWPS